MLIFEFAQDPHLLKQPILLLDGQVIDLADHDFGNIVGALLALSKRVIILHYKNDLLRHGAVIRNIIILDNIKILIYDNFEIV